MRRKFMITALSLLLFYSFLAHAAAPPKSTGVEALNEASRKAILANDIEALAASYSKDAVKWSANRPEVKGREEIRKSYARFFEGGTIKEITFTNAHYETAGNISVGWGEFSMTIARKSGGNPMVRSGRFIKVAKQEGGKWVYVFDNELPKPGGQRERFREQRQRNPEQPPQNPEQRQQKP